MSRTRMVSLVALGVYLAIVVLSLALRLLDERGVAQLFIGCTVFGVGVVMLDFLGLFGHHSDDGSDGDDLGGATVGHAGHDDAGPDLSDVIGPHGDASHAPVDLPVGHAGHAAGQGHPAVSEPLPAAVTVLSVLTTLRTLVYFSLGFGPVGWAALASGWGAWGSLAVAVPVGGLALALATAFFRFQRRDTGAVTGGRDLVGEPATVLVALDHQTVGKVRVRAGMSVSDLYARASEPGQACAKGDTVTIVSVSRDEVWVR